VLIACFHEKADSAFGVEYSIELFHAFQSGRPMRDDILAGFGSDAKAFLKRSWEIAFRRRGSKNYVQKAI
jgi:hypothetical protein